MQFWVIVGLLACATALALIWPLGRARTLARRNASDIAIYKDQLAEIDRDAGRGLIAAGEAQAARIEVQRRLIEADAAGAGDGVAARPLWRRLAALFIITVVPLGSLALYTAIGSPRIPDLPFASRTAPEAPQNTSTSQLLAAAEQRLKEHPDDLRGWQVLAPAYFSVGRYEDARNALAQVLRLAGSSAEVEANFGLAATMAARGTITPEALAAFERAHKLAPKEPMVRYMIGKAREQAGDKAAAIAAWREILDLPDVPETMTSRLRAEIAALENPGAAAPASGGAVQPGPGQEDIAAAEKLSPQERRQMVEGMVSRLSDRLKDQGGSLDDWIRLVRANVVLGRPEAARTALADARKALATTPDAGKALDGVAASLGLKDSP